MIIEIIRKFIRPSILSEIRKPLVHRKSLLAGSTALLAFSSSTAGFSATGFGSRNEISTSELASPGHTLSTPGTTPDSNIVYQSPKPPSIEGVEWVRVPYDKAENEVLALFRRDLPKLEDTARFVAVYEVRATGTLPADYQKNFRSKMERVLLTSKKLKVKQCPSCEESRIYKTESGQLKYETFSTDNERTAKIGNEIGVDHFIYSEITYTPEDLQMRVKLVQADNGQVKWSKDYSTADVIKTREALNDADPDELGNRDALSRVIIGEVAFTVILSAGIGYYPTVDNGGGSQLKSAPTAELFIGEKFDRGHKLFGFAMGGAANLGGAEVGTPLPFILRIGPRFGYTFNPYNITSARYSLLSEVGGLISPGVTTAYFSIGPEIKMIQRFSVSVLPMYILPASVAGAETLTQQDNGTYTSSNATAGNFGGFGFLTKVSIHW